MTNSAHAKQLLLAEVRQAQARLEKLQTYIDAMQKAIAALDSLDTKENVLPVKAIQHTVGVMQKKAASRTATSWKRAKQAQHLPATSGDWFPSLLQIQPQSKTELVQAMINKVGFELDASQLRKMKARLDFFLNHGMRNATIETSGSGRGRLFFRPATPSDAQQQEHPGM